LARGQYPPVGRAQQRAPISLRESLPRSVSLASEAAHRASLTRRPNPAVGPHAWRKHRAMRESEAAFGGRALKSNAHVGVYWPQDGFLYPAIINSFNQRRGVHFICYMNGERESLNLDAIFWRSIPTRMTAPFAGKACGKHISLVSNYTLMTTMSYVVPASQSSITPASARTPAPRLPRSSRLPPVNVHFARLPSSLATNHAHLFAQHPLNSLPTPSRMFTAPSRATSKENRYPVGRPTVPNRTQGSLRLSLSAHVSNRCPYLMPCVLDM
jgi:hypothetical protein